MSYYCNLWQVPEGTKFCVLMARTASVNPYQGLVWEVMRECPSDLEPAHCVLVSQTNLAPLWSYGQVGATFELGPTIPCVGLDGGYISTWRERKPYPT